MMEPKSKTKWSDVLKSAQVPFVRQFPPLEGAGGGISLPIIYTLLLLLITPILYAQNISSKTFYRYDEARKEFLPDQSFRWYYDAMGQDTLNEAWQWDQESNSFQLSFRRRTSYSSFGERLVENTRFWEAAGIRISQREWEYDAEGRNIVFSEYRQNATESALSPFSRWEKSFDAQGCLSAQTYYQETNPIRRDRYFYDTNCRLDSFFRDEYDAGNWQPAERTLYEYQDSLETQIDSRWQDNSWTFRRRLNLIYNSKAQLLQWRATYPDSSQFRLEYAYDSMGNQTYYAESQLAVQDSVWDYFLAEQKSYDAEGKVISQINFFDYEKELRFFWQRNERERQYGTDGRITFEFSDLINLRLADTLVSETIFTFEYVSYCDGLLWWENIFRNLDRQVVQLSRIEYGYEESPACEEVAIGLTLAPNPVGDQLSFYSQDLIEANSEIRIYDLQQKLVHSELVPFRCAHYILDVARLNAGIYFLDVRSANSSSYTKFIKTD